MVFIPLRDHNPRVGFPLVTVTLVVVNALVHLWGMTLPEAELDRLILTAGAIPREIMTLEDLPPASLVPPPFTIVTSMFLHGNLLHLLGNLWFLWIFGDNVEDLLGRGRYAFFYVVTAVVGACAQAFMMPESEGPMIGASGAIAGTLGGYIMSFPHARVVALGVPIGIPAWIFLGIWFLGQFFIGDASGIAWMAHVGGFLAGLGLVRIFAPERPPVIAVDPVRGRARGRDPGA